MSESPPPLSSLSLRAPQKSLELKLTPTVTTSLATPARESPTDPPLATTEATTSTSKTSPLKSPQFPVKLATLSKPSTHSLLTSAFRGRNARHSIDVRTLPSYLARKRQSTFGQFLTGLYFFCSFRLRDTLFFILFK
jgi:hypothetical protein